MPRKPNTTKERYNDPFPTRLRTLMAEKNITQEDLCTVLNVKSRQSVTGYIDGSTIPTIDKIISLAEYFEVSADWLIGLPSPKTNNINLRAVCEYTGLSEESIIAIKRLPPRLLETLGGILIADTFEDYLIKLTVCTELTQHVGFSALSSLNTLPTLSTEALEEKTQYLQDSLRLARLCAYDFHEVSTNLFNEVSKHKTIREQTEKVIQEMDEKFSKCLGEDN